MKIIAAAILTAALAAGCATPGVQSPEAKLPADEGSPGFLDRMSSQATVSENDAMRGMLMLLDGDDEAATFGERVDALKQRGVVGEDWDFVADRPIRKGRLAYMVYQAADVPGGVILTAFGPSQRYCLRELQYRGFMSEGFVTSKVTGMEYVAVLTRADSYRRTGELPTAISKTTGR